MASNQLFTDVRLWNWLTPASRRESASRQEAIVPIDERAAVRYKMIFVSWRRRDNRCSPIEA